MYKLNLAFEGIKSCIYNMYTCCIYVEQHVLCMYSVYTKSCICIHDRILYMYVLTKSMYIIKGQCCIHQTLLGLGLGLGLRLLHKDILPRTHIYMTTSFMRQHE